MQKIDLLLFFLALLGVGVIVFATYDLFVSLSHTTHFIQT